MDIKDFEAELQIIHKDFTIRAHPKIEGLANVYFQGIELFPIPNFNIYDARNEQYCWETPLGDRLPHRTRIEAIAMAREMAKKLLTDRDYRDAATGAGEYSDEKLQIGKFKPTIQVDLTPIE